MFQLLISHLKLDLRLAFRHIRRTPGFAVLVVGSLALGLGANTAIFSVVDAVLLRPLPYERPDDLLAIWSDNSRQHEPNNPVSPADFEAIRRAPSLAGAEAMYSFLIQSQVRLDAEPEAVQSSFVTPGMFALLGRQPILGRAFDAQTTTPAVVLSYEFWQRRFGGDVNVIGRTGTIGGGPPVPIIGVMPDGFVFPYRSMLGPSGFTRALQPDVWLPLIHATDGARYFDAAGQPNRVIHYLSVIARRRAGTSIDTVTRDLQAVATARATSFPDTNDGWRMTVRPLHEQAVGAVRAPMLLLLAGVAVVLLITCINVANVLLARAATRQHDLSIRSALGATGWRLIQQTLVESLLLSIAGGLAGLALAVGGIRLLIAAAPANLPRSTEVHVSWPVLGFAALLSALTGVVVGLLPALSSTRAKAQDALRESGRTTVSRVRRQARAALIVAEVAMAMLLAIGAGLLLRSFVAVMHVDPGFEPDGLLTMQITVPPHATHTPQAIVTYYDDLEARLRRLPGVVDVGGTTRLPLGSTNVTTRIDVDGRALSPADQPEVEFRRAVFDYFNTMRMPIVRGRSFVPADVSGPPVAIVNTVLAERVFAGQDPLAQRIRLTGGTDWINIIGVVGNIRHGSLEESPRPELYVYYRRSPPVNPFLAIRTAGDPAALAGAVRQAVRETGANPPVDLKTMAEIRSSSVAERRFVLMLVGMFGALALVLASVGVYGVVTLAAAERTVEMGVRLALGAAPLQVLRLVLGHSLRLALGGIAIGAAVAAASAPALDSQLFGIRARDPLTFAGVGCALLLIALVAAYVPARKAMALDPARTLRA